MLYKLFTGSSGLNNIVDPVRLKYDGGSIELAEAINVDIDETGRIGRRPGQVLLQSGNFHSLFCDNGDCFVVQDRVNDAALYKIGTDYSLAGVRSGLMKGAKVSYWQEGSKTYYSSNYQNGIIENGISTPWPTSGHIGATTTRVFHDAPLGTHIAIFYGRMWIVSFDVLWVSEPYAYGKFNLAKSFFQFDSNIRLVKPVQSGLWISTDEYTGFIRASPEFKDFSFEKKIEVPAHEYSANIELVDLSKAKAAINGLSAVWSCDLGLMAGTDAGNIVQLTVDTLLYPTGTIGATFIQDYNVINSTY